jgi:RNA polymerase sigma-70 factor, ECF subfamily
MHSRVRGRPVEAAPRGHARLPSHANGHCRSADAAFEDLVEPHIPGLVRLARRYMRSDDLAWDAVQESLLSLWQAPAPPLEPRPWLFRAVIHRCLHLRRTHRRRWHYEEQACLACLNREGPEDPAVRLEREQLGALVRRAILALPVEQRAVFLLKEIEGIDYVAIARRLNLPLGTVRSRLHRGRLALKSWLQQAVGEDTLAVARSTGS